MDMLKRNTTLLAMFVRRHGLLWECVESDSISIAKGGKIVAAASRMLMSMFADFVLTCNRVEVMEMSSAEFGKFVGSDTALERRPIAARRPHRARTLRVASLQPIVGPL